MWVLETAAVAFGLYSALPVPAFPWNEKNMRCALAAFPLVGAALALALRGWTALCAFLALPPLLAFAVIRLCVYYVVFFALCCALDPTARALRCLGLGFVLSRALSGLALTALPIAEGSSLARSFADAADKRRVRAILFAAAGLCLANMALFGGWRVFLAALCVTAAVALRCGRTALRQFGGVSGDLAGWFLVKEEFWLLAAVVAVQLMEKSV